MVARPAGHRGEERSKRRSNVADGPGEKRPRTTDQLPLDDLDIGLVRDDEPGVTIEELEVTLEQERNLAGMRRSDNEREAHRGHGSRVARGDSRAARTIRPGPLEVVSDAQLGLLHRLRLATATRDRNARRRARARITKISLLCTAASVVERHAHDGAFAFAHLGLTSVTDKNGLSSHDFLLGSV